ncbi:unnamed protein product [Sympodiomycopsis kandeliae]
MLGREWMSQDRNRLTLEEFFEEQIILDEIDHFDVFQCGSLTQWHFLLSAEKPKKKYSYYGSDRSHHPAKAFDSKELWDWFCHYHHRLMVLREFRGIERRRWDNNVRIITGRT